MLKILKKVVEAVAGVVATVARGAVRVLKFAWSAWRWVARCVGKAVNAVVETITGRALIADLAGWFAEQYLTYLPVSLIMMFFVVPYIVGTETFAAVAAKVGEGVDLLYAKVKGAVAGGALGFGKLYIEKKMGWLWKGWLTSLAGLPQTVF